MALTMNDVASTEAPALPTGVLTLQPPPDRVDDQTAGNIVGTLLPMVGSLGAMTFMAFNSSNPTSLIMGGAMAFAMASMAGFNIYRQIIGHRRQVDTTRREYLTYLTQMRDTVRNVARQQRQHLLWANPDPAALGFAAEEGSRVWRRRIDHPAALVARVGLSTQDLSMTIELPDLPPLANPDAVCLSAVSQFALTQSQVEALPLAFDLGQWPLLEIVGPADAVRGELRAIVCQLATLTSPQGLIMAVLCDETRRADWEWMKWLPHVGSTEAEDAAGPERLIVTQPDQLMKLLSPDLVNRGSAVPRSSDTPWPHLLLIVDQANRDPGSIRLLAPAGVEGVTVVSLPQTWSAVASDAVARLAIRPPASPGAAAVMEVLTGRATIATARPDNLSLIEAEAIARRLTRYRDTDQDDGSVPVGNTADPAFSRDLMDLLGIGDIRAFNPDRQWHYRTGHDRLRVPFGVTPTGTPVLIDLKESAEQGMGPHGLLIGATGSGKSEVLRTMVLALTLTHSPEQLNLVLVDFKGGATFAGMADLPHVSATISNLASDLSLVDRMEDALRGEMTRRQEVLRDAGNFANVNDYEAARRSGQHDYPPLPALFLVLDEFSELLSANPDFINTFVAIGRLGRSLAIHLLLASQRLEESRLRGLESHLSYRIGLRTFSAAESRVVLGVGDANDLPPIPGVGYLKTGSADAMIRFRASYVAAPPPQAIAEAGLSRDPAGRPGYQIVAFTSTHQALPAQPADSEPEQNPEPAPEVTESAPTKADPWAGLSEMAIAVELMKGHGQAHQIWLPPLNTPDTYADLMPDLAVAPGFGLVSVEWRRRGWFRVPLGTVDIPLEQRRQPLVFDLSGAGGHLAVVGGPLTGKSTFLRSLVMALSLTYTPQEVQFYILDFGGGTFAAFRQAIHVAGVATRDQPDVINRMMSELEAILTDREIYFRGHNIDSISAYRRGRAAGTYDDGYGDVFVVVDGWGVLHADFPDLEMRISALSTRALTYGVHLIVSAARWLDLRQNLRDIMGSRFELRLGDPSDSEFDRKLAQRVPADRPGRGIDASKHHALIALPRIDGQANPASLTAGVSDALTRIAQAWTGPAGPKLRLLPDLAPLADVQALAPGARQIVLGIEETRLGPALFDPWTEAHLYLFGDAGTGKTSFLRALARDIQRVSQPDQAQIYLVDIKRSLLSEIPDGYLAGYLTTREAAEDSFQGLAAYLQTRLPGPDVTPAQLRTRSWWTGAEAWVLVDDYDLVATSSGNPVLALQPLMAQAHDIGLHIVIVRRSGGASRAQYDPMIQTMTELGTTGILLPGSADEGPLIGRYAPTRGVPGRAQIISREHGRVAAQLAWAEPTV